MTCPCSLIGVTRTPLVMQRVSLAEQEYGGNVVFLMRCQPNVNFVIEKLPYDIKKAQRLTWQS